MNNHYTSSPQWGKALSLALKFMQSLVPTEPNTTTALQFLSIAHKNLTHQKLHMPHLVILKLQLLCPTNGRACVGFAAYFNKISSVLNFRLFSGIVLLISKDTCMVPAGFTLAEHSCHGTVPWWYYANQFFMPTSENYLIQYMLPILAYVRPL